MYLIVYIYSARMAITEPDQLIWGYICAFTFPVIFLLCINTFVNHNNKINQNETLRDKE